MYDVGFLVLFSIWVAWFLRSRKKSLAREGIIFMYRTQLGVKAIKYIPGNNCVRPWSRIYELERWLTFLV